MPKIVITLRGEHGGELDSISIVRNASDEAIKRVVQELVDRCTIAIGDTITITEED